MTKGVVLSAIAALMLLFFPLPEGPGQASAQQADTGALTPPSFQTAAQAGRNSVGRTRVDQADRRLSAMRSNLTLASARKPAANTVNTETVVLPDKGDPALLATDPLELLHLENIKALYTSPAIPGEGVWQSANTPRDRLGRPVIYTTVYRPSISFPNAIVFMMVVDMSKAFMQYYVGSQEPAARMAASEVEPALRPWLCAITNAMWMQRHSRGAGAIFRGKIVYPMIDGMATLIIYKDGSVDIQEWSSDIPIDLVRDARQLRHLIVKNGMIVREVLRKGRLEDSEIGLGFLLGGGGRSYEGEHAWYVAHRSAFGIRPDGNLVFAIGHHIGTQDLAKALVLAGCERALHADANPSNIVGNLYLRDSQGNLVSKSKLSPEQTKYMLRRYDDGYSKDFFAFFFKEAIGAKDRSLTKRHSPRRSR